MLHVPASVVKAKAAPYMARGKPVCRNQMVNEADYNIVGRFGAEYRGIVQYYLLAGDVFRLHRLRWAMELSMLKTLARKHHSSVSKMATSSKPRSTHRTGYAGALKPVSNAQAGSRWSHGSAAYPLSGTRPRSFPTVSRPDRFTRTRS